MRWLCLVLFCCSCTCQQVFKARTEYLDPTYLASTQVRTPEPCYPCFIGEQVVVKWHLPNCPLDDTHILLSLRFKDQALTEVIKPLTRRNGYWIYRLVNQDYWAHEGILSYSAKVVHADEVLYRWDHHLWQDIIHLESGL